MISRCRSCRLATMGRTKAWSSRKETILRKHPPLTTSTSSWLRQASETYCRSCYRARMSWMSLWSSKRPCRQELMRSQGRRHCTHHHLSWRRAEHPITVMEGGSLARQSQSRALNEILFSLSKKTESSRPLWTLIIAFLRSNLHISNSFKLLQSRKKLEKTTREGRIPSSTW